MARAAAAAAAPAPSRASDGARGAGPAAGAAGARRAEPASAPRTSVAAAGALARPAAAPALPGARRAAAAAVIIEPHAGEAEHRHFPRARLAARFELWREGEGASRSFSASLRSVNVSVSGAFLESSFFLPVGTELRVRFELEDDAEPVEARAVIVREQRGGESGLSGFGVRFEEFFGQTEVALAKLFLGLRLRSFAEEYLQSKRARGLPNELERVVDALAAWELIKATSETDPWRGE
ncbi:PilZ domain-containing protein [Aggregicoccus sp. 17bor-14]|uniref:PilZ domain-containing protein n=1 Tax=Myxococcaceae TaxID=31 RepID=UPI00351A4DF8